MEKINLSAYCPDKETQYKATCYAYAVVYTAMSTLYNLRKEITDRETINNSTFSPGIVASYHNSKLPFRKRSWRCGRYGTAKKSLDILKKTGTVFSKDYDCDCEKFRRIKRRIPDNVQWYKIEGYKRLEINNRFSEDYTQWIRTGLTERNPIIITIHQNAEFKSNRSIALDLQQPDSNTLSRFSKTKGTSNHVVCILGYHTNYNESGLYFLVKNNYTRWGENGFSWVKATFLIPLINDAYIINSITTL